MRANRAASRELLMAGKVTIADADLKRYFDTIVQRICPKDRLLALVGLKVSDGPHSGADRTSSISGSWTAIGSGRPML